MIKNVVVISDLHCGCQLGLYPDDLEIPLDNGGVYKASKIQKKIYNYWLYFWYDWVPTVTKGEPYVVVINGDALDGIHHNSVTQISQNMADQLLIAETVLKPIRERAEKLYLIRGTEAHVGKSAQYEEILAKNLRAEPTKAGKYSRWELWLRLNDNVLIHFAHHIPHTSVSHYASTAVSRELMEAFLQAGRWHNKPPDMIVRSHRHRCVEVRFPSGNTYAIGLVTPAWQLVTPYGYRTLPGKLGISEIGGCLIRHGDEDVIYSRFHVMPINQTEVVNI